MLPACDKLRCPGRVLCRSEKLSFGKREKTVWDGQRDVRLSKIRMSLMLIDRIRYVIIEDFYSIGEEPRDEPDEDRHDRYTELIKTPQHQSIKTIDERYGSTKRRILHADEGSQQEHNKNRDDPFFAQNSPDSLPGPSHEKDVTSKGFSKESSISPTASARSEQRKRKRDDPFDEIDPNLTPRIIKMTKLAEEEFSVRNSVRNSMINTNGPTIPPALERNRPLIARDGENVDEKPDNQHMISKTKLDTSGEEKISIKRNKRAGKLGSPNPIDSANRPSHVPRPIEKTNALLPIKRPLQLRSLESVTGQHATRNKVHDVFGVICSVDASVIKPATMPLKRDMRIMDRSTDKKVLVSVFVDPVHFQPRVGTVALFRSVTTHEWDRGMLNVYPQQCGGKAWFVPDPVGVPGCDVAGMKDWWRTKMENAAVD